MSTALRVFHAFLDEFEEVRKFILLSAELRPRIGGLVQWEAVDGDSRSSIQQFSALRGDYKPRLFGSLLVTCQAGLEQYVREALIERFNKVQASYAELHRSYPSLILHNLQASGQFLTRVFSPLPYVKISNDQVLSRLHTSLTTSASVSLNSELLAQNTSNLDGEKLSEFFRRMFGKELDWDGFGRIKQLQELFKARGIRETAKLVESRLSIQTGWRNELAHTQGASKPISEQDFHFSLQFLRLFATEFDRQLEAV